MEDLSESESGTGSGNNSGRFNFYFNLNFFLYFACYSGLAQLIMVPKIPLMEKQIMLQELIFCKSLADTDTKQGQ